MEYFIGISISLMVEGIKKIFGTNKFGTLIVLAVISLIVGTVYYFLKSTIYWQAIVQILVTAGAFHNLVIRHVER